MLRGALESGLMRTLLRRADSRAFPVVVGVVALAATLSMSVPFATLLVAAVLMARRRWGAIAVGASLGAALGAAWSSAATSMKSTRKAPGGLPAAGLSDDTDPLGRTFMPRLPPSAGPARRRL